MALQLAVHVWTVQIAEYNIITLMSPIQNSKSGGPDHGLIGIQFLQYVTEFWKPTIYTQVK